MYKKPEIYTARTGPEFLVLEHYDLEGDPWVRYRNQQTKQEYTCRLEAFLQRFSPLAA